MNDYKGEERRVDHTALIELIRETIKETVTQIALEHPITPEEVQWVRLAIKAEVDRAELRKAIIEKTLTGLVWTALCAIGVYFIDWFSAHWVSHK